MRRTAGPWYLLVLVAAIIGLGLLLRPVLFVIVAAAIYAFITWPLSSTLAKRMPRTVAVVAANIGIACVILAVPVFDQTTCRFGESTGAMNPARPALLSLSVIALARHSYGW